MMTVCLALLLLLLSRHQLQANPAVKDKNLNEDGKSRRRKLGVFTKSVAMVEEVEVIVGSMARLPCDLMPPEDNDSVALVIWYKDEHKKPIYSMDVRERELHKGIHWADGDLEGRAQFSGDVYQSALTLANSRGSDTGLYTCRVDFKQSPTRNHQVNVTVIVPPDNIYLEDSEGKIVTAKTLGPFPEGSQSRITCISTGGVPTPRITWWYNLTLLDDSFDVLSDGRVQNQLLLDKTEREHLHGVLTCQALNNPFVLPRTVSVTIDLYLGPLDVRLIGENSAMSAGYEYEVACHTWGSRPPATLTWWKSGVPLLLPARDVSSMGGNVTTSTVRLRPLRSDHGAKVSCRATNPSVPNRPLEASWTLNVYFVPSCEVVLAHHDNSSVIREGMSLSLECLVQANPPATTIHWLHNGVEIRSGMDYQVSPTNSLDLLFVTRENSGMYSCSAANTEGVTESVAVSLDVKYTPRCKSQDQRLVGASRKEDVTVPCETTGNPPATRFWWRHLVSSQGQETERDFSTSGQDGVTSTTVSLLETEGYITLYCWAENDIGNQSVPCSIRVVFADNPEPPSNCSVTERGETCFSVECLTVREGGLPSTFVAEVSVEGRLVTNVSRSGAAQFTVTGLEPGRVYSVSISAQNIKGSSQSALLQVGTTGRIITERRTTSSEVSANTLDVPQILVLTSLIPFMALVILVGLIVLHRKCKQHEELPLKQNKAGESCTASDDDKNPDVVPCTTELTVLENTPWNSQLIVSTPHHHDHPLNTPNVPSIQSWGCNSPNIFQRHVETQTNQSVLESVV